MSIPPAYDNSPPPNYEKGEKVSFSETLRRKAKNYGEESERKTKEKLDKKIKKKIEKNIDSAYKKLEKKSRKGLFTANICTFTCYKNSSYELYPKYKYKRDEVFNYVKKLNDSNIYGVKINIDVKDIYIPFVVEIRYEMLTLKFDWSK